MIKHTDVPSLKEIAIEEAINCPAGRLVLIDKLSKETIEPLYSPSISFIIDSVEPLKGAI